MRICLPLSTKILELPEQTVVCVRIELETSCNHLLIQFKGSIHTTSFCKYIDQAYVDCSIWFPVLFFQILKRVITLAIVSAL